MAFDQISVNEQVAPQTLIQSQRPDGRTIAGCELQFQDNLFWTLLREMSYRPMPPGSGEGSLRRQGIADGDLKTIEIFAQAGFQDLEQSARIVRGFESRGGFADGDIAGEHLALLRHSLPKPGEFGELVIIKLAHSKKYPEYQKPDYRQENGVSATHQEQAQQSAGSGECIQGPNHLALRQP